MLIVVDIAIIISLLVLLVGVVYGRFSTRRLTLRLRFSQSEATEGDTLHLAEELTNDKPLPLPLVNANFRVSKTFRFLGAQNASVSDDYYQSDLFSVGAWQRITRRLAFTATRRGVFTIKSIDVTVEEPLFRRRGLLSFAAGQTLVVLPRTLPFAQGDALFRSLAGEVTIRRFTNPDPFAFRGIREYLPGDALPAVNFAASAKAGQLMVNQYDATSSQRLYILLNLQPYQAFARALVQEEAIRIAASAAAYFARLGVTVGLVTNGPDLATGLPVTVQAGGGAAHAHSIRRALARVDLEQEAPPFVPLPLPAPAQEAAWLVVSAYHGEDMQYLFARLQTGGQAAKWILPHERLAPVALPQNAYTQHWEVKAHGG